MVPLARTDAEALLYLSLVRCDACDQAGFTGTPTAMVLDGAPHTRFDGTCPGCGHPRCVVVRRPAAPLPAAPLPAAPLPAAPFPTAPFPAAHSSWSPPAASSQAASAPPPPSSLSPSLSSVLASAPGASRPGRRLDFGGDTPSGLLDPGDWLAVADRADLADDLPLAAAALEEVLKFIPPGADRVPLAAFRGDAGRESHAREPGRFERAPLEWTAATYRRIAETPQAPPPARAPLPVAPAVITRVGYLSMTKLRLRVLHCGVERDYTFATEDVSLDPAIRADEAFLADFGGSDLYAPILAQVRKAFQLELAPVPVPLHP
jgi:hypothetical protein